MRVDSRRADDGIRTRDPHLGKVMRYQLRYIRMLREQILWTICCSRCDAEHYPTDTLLTNRLVRGSESGKCAGGECRDGTKTHPWAAIWVPDVDPCSLCPRAPTPLRVARGPVAQWKSVPFTPGRSLVRSQPGPQESRRSVGRLDAEHCPRQGSLTGSTCAVITAPASKPGIFPGGTPRTDGTLLRSRSLRRGRRRGCSRSRPGLSSAAPRCNPARRRCGYVGVRQGFPVSSSCIASDPHRGARTSSPPPPQLRGVVEDQGEGDAFAGADGRDSVSDRSCRPPALRLDGTVPGGEHVAMTLRQQERGSP